MTNQGISPAVLRVLGVASLSVGALSRPPTLAATAAGVGLVLFVWSLYKPQDSSEVSSPAFRWAAVASIAVLMLRLSTLAIGPLRDSELSVRVWWVALLVAGAGVGLVAGARRAGRIVSIGLSMLAVLVVTGAMTVGEWRSDIGFDVYRMHLAAGEALLDGANPYTDAVQVPNGSPFAPEGAVIEGYPYTPPALAAFGGFATALDPRLVSSIAWLGVLAWFGVSALRRGPKADVAFAMFLLLAGLAVWPIIWFAAWTEPLSVGLLLVAGALWTRRPVASAVALGLALASKQYFMFLAPLLLFLPDRDKGRRIGVSLGVAAAAMLAGLLPNPPAFIQATLVNLTDIGFRPDSQSLSGLLAENGVDFFLPSWAWILAGLVTALLVGKYWSGRIDFVGRAGLTMGIVLFLGQSFPNYWYLVLALLAMSSVLSERDGDPTPVPGGSLSVEAAS